VVILPELPSFLNIVDFFGTFVPGYVAVTLYLVLFHGDLFFTSSDALSFDIFSAIVFIIAGPTIGLALKQFTRQVQALYYFFKDREAYNKVVDTYTKFRLLAKDSQKLELDRAEAGYDFSMSTSLAMAVLGGYYWHSNGFEPSIIVPLFIFGGVLLMGGVIERQFTLFPTYRKLAEELFKPVTPSDKLNPATQDHKENHTNR
jgi:hypothetical protein